MEGVSSVRVELCNGQYVLYYVNGHWMVFVHWQESREREKGEAGDVYGRYNAIGCNRLFVSWMFYNNKRLKSA